MRTKELRLKNLARQQARDTLGLSASFHRMTGPDKLAMYKEVYQSAYDRLRAKESGNGGGRFGGLARGMAKGKDKPLISGELIDASAHESDEFDKAAGRFGEFVEEVDFPQFVSDLLEGVFDANLKVTLDQMTTYMELLKEASKSVSQFITAIDETAAFGYLAENQGDDFSLDFDEDNKDEQGNPQPVLTDKEGNVVATKDDLGDNEVKAKIMDAKIAMAQEHRAMLREVILMGITRLVVEKGTVKASVLFDFKATEKIQRVDKAAAKTSHVKTGGSSGGFLGFYSRSGSEVDKSSTLTVSSMKSQRDTELAAKLAGSVEIIFKSDYFKLDNFKDMYSVAKEQSQEAATPAATPAATA